MTHIQFRNKYKIPEALIKLKYNTPAISCAISVSYHISVLIRVEVQKNKFHTQRTKTAHRALRLP